MNGIFVIRVLVIGNWCAVRTLLVMRHTAHVIRRVLSLTTPWIDVLITFIRTMVRNMALWLGGVVRAQHPTRYGDYLYICVPRHTYHIARTNREVSDEK
jgi:hypothetical protein